LAHCHVGNFQRAPTDSSGAGQDRRNPPPDTSPSPARPAQPSLGRFSVWNAAIVGKLWSHAPEERLCCGKVRLAAGACGSRVSWDFDLGLGDLAIGSYAGKFLAPISPSHRSFLLDGDTLHGSVCSRPRFGHRLGEALDDVPLLSVGVDDFDPLSTLIRGVHFAAGIGERGPDARRTARHPWRAANTNPPMRCSARAPLESPPPEHYPCLVQRDATPKVGASAASWRIAVGWCRQVRRGEGRSGRSGPTPGLHLARIATARLVHSGGEAKVDRAVVDCRFGPEAAARHSGACRRRARVGTGSEGDDHPMWWWRAQSSLACVRSAATWPLRSVSRTRSSAKRSGPSRCSHSLSTSRTMSRIARAAR
jgi:hypothetical protein